MWSCNRSLRSTSCVKFKLSCNIQLAIKHFKFKHTAWWCWTQEPSMYMFCLKFKKNLVIQCESLFSSQCARAFCLWVIVTEVVNSCFPSKFYSVSMTCELQLPLQFAQSCKYVNPTCNNCWRNGFAYKRLKRVAGRNWSDCGLQLEPPAFA